MKTIGREDQTPACTSATLNIKLIACTISTERSRGEECLLKYETREDFFHGCDSRFTLIKRNQTVFLHLNNLTSEDSGNYTCQCRTADGAFVLHLIVTVKGLDAFSRKVNVEGEHKHKGNTVQTYSLLFMWVKVVTFHCFNSVYQVFQWCDIHAFIRR